MKSLKGRFIQTNIWMVIISFGLMVAITVVLFVLPVLEGGEFQLILKLFCSSSDETQEGSRLVIYGILWAGLVSLAIICTCVVLSSQLYASILKPINELKEGAQNIAEGNLDFDVMACGDQELNDLCSAFDEIRKRLKANAIQELKVEEERSMLMANLSHDMRTPITTIKGYAEGLRDGVAASPEKMKQYVDTICSKALVLERLVDSMTEYSELELGRMQYVFEYVDAGRYLQDLAEEYTIDVTQRGFQMKLSLSGCQGITIVADRSKLKRVMDNLISNAMKYNKEKGMVCLSSETDGKGVLICISDSGTGIKKESLEKVFDGFYRGDAARSNIKGNGLGLSIAKQIVESHRGKIWIKSQEGVGTEVFIYLPIREKEQA